jgi:hypothetical protein
MKQVPVKCKYRIIKRKDSYKTNAKWTICHYNNSNIMSECECEFRQILTVEVTEQVEKWVN